MTKEATFLRAAPLQQGFYRLAYLLYALPAVWFSVRMFFDDMNRMLLNFPWQVAGWGDGGVDWEGARLFLAGRSPYTPEGLREIGLEQYGFGHPPTTPFWFLPVAKLDHATMAQSIAILCLIVLLLHVWICASELRLPAPIPTTLLVFTWVVSTSWMQEHLHIVQISEFIAFAYVVAWYHLKRGRDVVAGMTLGLACTMKLFPGVMVFYLLLKRRWRALASAVVSYMVVAVVMTAGYGISSWRLFFQQQGPISTTWMGHIRNASLSGIVLRVFTPTCIAQALPTAKTLLVAEVIALFLVVAASQLTRRAERRRASIDFSYALFTVLSVFINPWTWEHYSVFLIFPVLMFVSKLWHGVALTFAQWTRTGLSLRALATRGAIFVTGVGMVVAIVRMLNIEMTKKSTAFAQYPARGVTHRELHWLEIANWLPWVLMLLTFGCLLFFAGSPRRSDRFVTSSHRRDDGVRALASDNSA